MPEMELTIEPSVSLRINGRLITPHQMEVLRAVYREGSQNRAAFKLGITTPVLNRYLAQLRSKVGVDLLLSTPTGTKLTEQGERMVLEYEALVKRMREGGSLVVGGTVITEDLLLNVLSEIDKKGHFDLVISDDKRNLEDFNAGLMNLVILDDPLYLYDLEGISWEEVADDTLIHVYNGSRYVRFAYGAQRIGFKHLDALGREYHIEGILRSIPLLIKSGLSFFINESLAARKGLRLKSATDRRYLSHKINAVFREDSKDLRRIVAALQRDSSV